VRPEGDRAASRSALLLGYSACECKHLRGAVWTRGCPLRFLPILPEVTSATRPRADPAPKLLATKGLLQGGDGNVWPSQIDHRVRSKNGKVQKNNLHILALQELRRRRNFFDPERREHGCRVGVGLQERDIFDSPAGPLSTGSGWAPLLGLGCFCSRLGTVAMLITTMLEMVWPERAAVRSLVGSRMTSKLGYLDQSRTALDAQHDGMGRKPPARILSRSQRERVR
jgi:hypothetical protein